MEDKIPIYVMGKKYYVPRGVTIMKAMEYAGYRYIRGCGCRGGFCGACGTVYRTKNSYKLKVGLACQTTAIEDMHLTQIPFFPANKAIYNIDDLEPTLAQIIKLYPELYRCVSCNSCTKICPQDIQVMDYIQAALQGDISRVADSSFDCIMCGLCAVRCPSEIVQYNIALLCRRLYGKYIVPKAKHLEARISEILKGKFDKELEKLMRLDEKSLRKQYNEREIEPD